MPPIESFFNKLQLIRPERFKKKDVQRTSSLY